MELRAQVDRAIASGMRPTYIDAHMAVAMLPELLDAHVRLGWECRMFLVPPRSIKWAPDHAAYQATLRTLDVQGAPVVDHCRGTLPVMRDELAHGWVKVFTELPPGLTHLALHCTVVGDFAAMSPLHAP